MRVLTFFGSKDKIINYATVIGESATSSQPGSVGGGNRQFVSRLQLGLATSRLWDMSGGVLCTTGPQLYYLTIPVIFSKYNWVFI